MQLPVQHFQAFLGNIVRLYIIDGNLQVIQPCAVQSLDPFGREKIAVGDHARDHAPSANVRDQQIEIGMQEWFAAADGDDGRPQALARWSSHWYMVSTGTGLV